MKVKNSFTTLLTRVDNNPETLLHNLFYLCHFSSIVEKMPEKGDVFPGYDSQPVDVLLGNHNGVERDLRTNILLKNYQTSRYGTSFCRL